MHFIPDIAYGPDPAHRLDLFLPAMAPRATILFAHGGGFRKGDRKGAPVGAFSRALTARGFALASAGYRLATGWEALSGPQARALRTAIRRGRREGLTLSRKLCGPMMAAAAQDLALASDFCRSGTEEALRGPVILLGLSAGAIAGAALVWPHRGLAGAPHPPDALIGIAGAVAQPWEMAPGRPPALFFHGSADRVIGPKNLEIAAREAAGSDADFTLLPTGRRGHAIQAQEVLTGHDGAGTPWLEHVFAWIARLPGLQ